MRRRYNSAFGLKQISPQKTRIDKASLGAR